MQQFLVYSKKDYKKYIYLFLFQSSVAYVNGDSGSSGNERELEVSEKSHPLNVWIKSVWSVYAGELLL